MLTVTGAGKLGPRKLALVLGVVAVGTLALVPAVASADPQPTIEQVQAQLDRYYGQAADANEAYNTAQVAEQQLQTQIAGLNSQMAQEQAAIVDTQSRIGSMAAAQYRAGGMDPTMQLLVQSDPKSVLDLAATVDRASQQGADALHTYAQAKANLETERKDASAKLGQLDQKTKDAAAKKKSFEDDVAKAQALLGSLQDAQRKQLAAAQAAKDAAAQKAAAAQLAALRSASTSSSASPSASSSGSSGSSAPSPSRPSASSSGSSSTPIPANGRAATAVAFAQAQLGKPYIFGGTGPGGYDCSGLTSSAWKAAGVSIPRTATAQMQGLTAVSASAAQPGDLVFFYGNSSYVNHVGLYIGGGMVIHAPRPGSTVSIAAVSTMPAVSYARP
jgi:cell wall-associated NlpC family hydrolase